jgi:hypothetical protein
MHLHERPPKSVGSAFLGREGISFIDAQASSSALCDVRLHALEVHFRSGDNTPQVDTLLSLSLSSIGVLYRAHRGAAPEVLLSMLDDEEEAPAMAPVPPDTTPEVLLSMLDDEEEALATARARSPSPAYQRVNGSPAYARNYPSDEHAGLSDELSGGAGGRSGVELEELEDPLPLTPTRRSPCAGHPLGVFIMQTVCKTGPRWNPVSPHDRGGDDESDERSTPPDRAPCARATGHWRSDGVEPESFWHRRVRCARVVHGEWTRKNRAGESWVEATGIWIG